VKVDKEGKPREGCRSCIDRGKHEHVYTARKFWTGEEVYGPEKNREMNHEWGENLLRNAARKQRGRRG
jgi:hypothetical protein